MYKFEIYRNPEKPQTIDGYDAVRYNESGYLYERNISPKWSDLSFSWSREDGRMFYRKKLQGSFMLIGDDFDWVNDIRLDANERNNNYRYLSIKENINGLWAEVWRGFFSIIAGEWDLSNCSVTFSDLVIWDEYTSILENMENEKNMMDIFSQTINISVSEYQFEQIIVTQFLSLGDNCSDLSLPPLQSSDVYYNYSTERWTLYDRYVRYVDPIGSESYFEAVRVYRREFVIQVTQPTASWLDYGEYPSGSGNETHKWVRAYLGYENPPVPLYDVITDYVVINDGGVTTACEYERRTLNTSDAPGLVDYQNDRARPFSYVLNYVFRNEIYPFILSYFFTDQINPITGTANEYNKMYFIQFSDILETSDPATKGLYSANDVEDWLRMMNVYWYLEDTPQGWLVRYEHREFFERGLSYDENSVDIDISSQNIPQKMKYKNKNLPRLFELIMAYDSGDDFNGIPIIYGGGMANWDKDGKESFSTGNMATDVRGATLNEDAGKDGFFLVATELTGVFPNIISGTGAWSGTYIYNKPLSIANLEQELFTQRGITAVGTMNGKDIEFDSVERNFIQENVDVAWCGDFNPYKLVRTAYGDGKVEEATLTLKDKRLTLTLSY